MSEVKPSVLLIEDSIEEVFLLRTFLEKAGFQVTHAQDGTQAARLITERGWDLVITDLNLPGIDGYDLIRLIKGRDKTTPIIANTGYTATHYVEQAYRVGADHVMIKPINRDEFIKKAVELAGAGAAAAVAAVPAATAKPGDAKAAEKAQEAKIAFAIAIGALPGDVEAGCGGVLLSGKEKGQAVLIIPLAGSGMDDTVKEAQRKSAEMMGARVIMAGAAVSQPDNPTEQQMLLERIVRELKPVIAFIPSLADDNPHRREAHRLSRTAVADVPTVLAYESGTSTHQFAPTRFVDVEPVMDRKLEALTPYGTLGRPDLEAGYVQAVARYWGRKLRFGEAEAFEVLRDQGKDVPPA